MNKYIVGVIMKGEGTWIKGEYNPGIVGMEVYGFDSGRSLKHKLFNFETKGHFLNIKVKVNFNIWIKRINWYSFD